MTQRTLPGEPPVEVTLRRSVRARRFSLRVSRLDGKVTLSMPARACETEALAFAEGKADWVRQILRGTAARLAVAPGSNIPFEGRRLVVTPAPVSAVRVEGTALLVPTDEARLGARILAFLKLAARQRLQAASQAHAATIGRRIRRITLRDTRSRWGSCTAEGGLMFSWRLIMAPPEVLDYVAAHEVAHLVEMNHSPAFWAVVARLAPDYERHRAWLRRDGAELHRVDF
ncbi:M48 family metallopeptidase [Defluviimonas sp. WL0024]|uniref:M48 family metallopeptidase n=2 Tax=Albidovulum TaxID=205889 RepID=A0ABT3J8L2_9RHOB|nr:MULTISPECIES: SprT family zinc-dependent metalloprotease [Defluviimonas]MCU9848808.1 M48 family metallopeptidase [Defluviimonas sp. WL0024]MCW3784027.1 M48 family metallopeptidase [Defluviimonas salinarum]